MNVEILRRIRLKLSMCGKFILINFLMYTTEEFEIYTTEPWIPEPSEIKVEMSIKKLQITFQPNQLMREERH